MAKLLSGAVVVLTLNAAVVLQVREAGSSGLAELSALEHRLLHYGRSGVEGLTEAWRSGALSLADLPHSSVQVSAAAGHRSAFVALAWRRFDTVDADLGSDLFCAVAGRHHGGGMACQAMVRCCSAAEANM